MPSRPQTVSPARLAVLRSQGAAIASARGAKGLSQPDAARSLGVGIWALRSWEQGRRGCPFPLRLRIAVEWGADREALAIDSEQACPCCGRPYP